MLNPERGASVKGEGKQQARLWSQKLNKLLQERNGTGLAGRDEHWAQRPRLEGEEHGRPEDLPITANPQCALSTVINPHPDSVRVSWFPGLGT